LKLEEIMKSSGKLNSSMKNIAKAY
jgi:hypothetical protein